MDRQDSLAIGDQSLSRLDPFRLSTECLLVVAFPKSSSPNFPFALGLAQGAAVFGAAEYGGKPLFVAGFSKTPDDAGRAVALLEYVRSWKGALVFARGRILKNLWKTLQVVDCFLDASSCSDPRAHCCELIDDPASGEDRYSGGLSFCIRLVEEPPETEEVEVDQYLFPCRVIRHQVDLRQMHPSSPRDRIEAAGIESDANICPFFNPDLYAKSGTRVIVREVQS